MHGYCTNALHTYKKIKSIFEVVVEVVVAGVVVVEIFYKKNCCCCCWGWKDFTDDWQVCQLKYSPQVARIWEFF